MEHHTGLVLGLYEAATQSDPARFQHSALALLNQVIGFDKAWWGIMSGRGGAPALMSSYRHELPDSFEVQWEGMKHQDNLARDVRLQPRTTVNFDERSLRGTPGLAALNETHDLRQALCTSAFLPDKESFVLVWLFRSAEARPFEDRDVRLKQAVTPHLYASWRTNLLFAMARGEESSRARNHAAGFVDRTGRIVCADANFAVMVAEGWPSWSGACVPRALLQGGDRAPGASARFRSRRRPVGGLLLLELDRVSPLQDLTPREREIALEYSSARSYKEIARDLGIAPATVRHHLRVIFDKLGIGTKAELVRLVDCAGAMPLAPSGTVPIDCLGGGAD